MTYGYLSSRLTVPQGVKRPVAQDRSRDTLRPNDTSSTHHRQASHSPQRTWDNLHTLKHTQTHGPAATLTQVSQTSGLLAGYCPPKRPTSWSFLLAWAELRMSRDL